MQVNDNIEAKPIEKQEIAQETQTAKSNADIGTAENQAARGWRFWAIFTGLCVTSLLAAVDGTITSTALPTIVYDLKADELYVWFVNAFYLSRYV